MNIEYSVVFSRLMSHLGVSTDAQVAQELGVSPQTLSTWKRRGTIPYERIVNLCIQNDYSLDEVLSGKCNSGAIDSELIKKIIGILRSDASQLKDVKLELLLDSVIMMYNSTHKLGNIEAKLVLQAQLEALNLSALTSISSWWEKYAVDNRHAFMNNPQLVEDIPSPFKELVKSLLEDEGTQIPSDTVGEKTQYSTKPSTDDAQVNQTITGENHTIAGRDISIRK